MLFFIKIQEASEKDISVPFFLSSSYFYDIFSQKLIFESDVKFLKSKNNIIFNISINLLYLLNC